MRCPNCSSDSTNVLDSRHSKDRTYIKRRRSCPICDCKFTTYERLPELEIVVVKKSGNKQFFSRSKIKSGIYKCCEKRNISDRQIENIVNSVEMKIKETHKNEITSIDIGEIVMEKLKEVDEVAYVRFVAVYKDFKDINSFLDYIKREF